METPQAAPSTEQLLLWHAERQTAAQETIRNYVFYLLLIVVVGLVFALVFGVSAASGV